MKRRKKRIKLMRAMLVLANVAIVILIAALISLTSVFLPDKSPRSGSDKGSVTAYDIGTGAAGTTGNSAMTASSFKSDGDCIYEGTEESLILVNADNPLPSDYKFSLTVLKNDQSVSELCYPSLQQMMDDCRSEGLSPLICSSYRSHEYQEKLFQNKIERLMGEGYSEAEARIRAGREVAIPGTSEHETGLAVDIVDKSYQLLDEEQEDTDVQKWLLENSWRYGWVLRYPPDKSDITGIIYEPWHYRFVGTKAAQAIHEGGLCLEEFLETLEK